MKRFLAILHARNMEFIRDRSALGWNLFFPVLLVLGFAVVFSAGPKPMFKVGVISGRAGLPPRTDSFFDLKYIQFIAINDQDTAVDKVRRFQIDMLISPGERRYWINQNSPNGQVLERLLGGEKDPAFERLTVTGRQIRYLDWVVPGILAVNMMFSCLFGVGYVIVRYRKNGFLKRLKATPLKPFEFLLAQMVSRLILIQTVTVAIYAGCNAFLHFEMRGSYANLFLISLAGAICLISLGLLVASRISSEELAGGILNLLTWPMMLLSGVWFSLEGTNPIVGKIAQFLPLTHLVDGARAIMTEGADLMQIAPHIAALAVMTGIFLSIGALVFRWE